MAFRILPPHHNIDICPFREYAVYGIHMQEEPVNGKDFNEYRKNSKAND